MTFLAGAQAAIGAGQLGLGLASLFGGKKGPKQRALGRFDSFIARSGSGRLSVNEGSPGVLGATLSLPGVDSLRGETSALRRDLRGLRASVQPGFGRLTRAAQAAVDNARSRAKGDIKDQLARRRILGSNFGADALIRAEREFANLEDERVGTATVQEIALTAGLLDQEFRGLMADIQSQISELGLAASVGTALLSGANAAQAAATKVLQQEAKGAGQGVASLFTQANQLAASFDKLFAGGGAPSDPSAIGLA